MTDDNNKQTTTNTMRQQRRRVSFADGVTCHTIDSMRCLARELWFSREDYQQFEANDTELIDRLDLGLPLSQHHCPRGLESRTMKGSYETTRLVLESVDAVLNEQQDSQWDDDGDDEDFLAAVYHPFTSEAGRIARSKALMDQDFVEEEVRASLLGDSLVSLTSSPLISARSHKGWKLPSPKIPQDHPTVSGELCDSDDDDCRLVLPASLTLPDTAQDSW